MKKTATEEGSAAISTAVSSLKDDGEQGPPLVFGTVTRVAVLVTATVGLLSLALASLTYLNSDRLYHHMNKVNLALFPKQQQQNPVNQQHKRLRQVGATFLVTADEGGEEGGYYDDYEEEEEYYASNDDEDEEEYHGDSEEEEEGEGGGDLEDSQQDDEEEGDGQYNHGVYFDNKEDKSPSGLAWIMSFPMSGSGEVADLVSAASGTVVAANNIGERQCHKQLFPALSASSKQRHSGPWLWLNDDDDVVTLNKPTGSPILTNTFCGSHCGNWCPPERFLNTPESFLRSCTASTGLIPGDGVHGKWELIGTHYSVDNVQKIIHLIGHPLANIVYRFENEWYRHGPRFEKDFPDTAEGFQNWCRSMDEYDGIMESDLLRKSGWLSQPGADKVPCLAEFIKYVQWHNLAFETAKKLQLPTMVVHTEDVLPTSGGEEEEADDVVDVFDSVALQGLLDFLELPNLKGWQLPGPQQQRQEQVLQQEVVVATEEEEEESSEDDYDDDDDSDEEEEDDLYYLSYFTSEQKDAIRTFLASASSDQTWEELMRYDFD